MPSRRGGTGLLGIVAVAALALVAAMLLAGRHSAPAGSPAAPAAKYGGIPKWLPQPKLPVDRVVTASAAKPALAIQGVSVSVHLGHGRVLATAVGPRVPEDGEFPVPATSPCTFVVSFASASGAVPIRPGDFTIVDDEGHLHHPEVTALGGDALPGEVPAGKTVSLRVHGVLPTGDGGLGWAPMGGRPIVTWDFDVEID